MADEKKTVKVEIDYDSNARELEQQLARLDSQTKNLVGRVSQLRETAKNVDSAQAEQFKVMADRLEERYKQDKEIQAQLKKIEQERKKVEADLKRIRNYTEAPVEFGEKTDKYGTHPYVTSKLLAGQRNPYARSKQNAYFKGDELISASTLMKMYSENRPRLNKTESVRKVIERLFKNFENPDSLVFNPTGENSDEEELLTELSYTMQKFQRAVFGAAKREKVNIGGVAAPLSRGAQKFLTGNLFYEAGDFTSGQRKATSEAQDKELEKIARGYYATGQVYLDEEYEAQLIRRYERDFAKDQIKNKSIAERAHEIRSSGKIIPDAAKYGQEGKIASVRNLVRFLTEGEVAKSIPRYENRLSDENKGILKEMQQLYDFILNDKALSKFFSFDSGIEDPLEGTEVQEKLVSYLNTLWEKLIQYREENSNKMSQKVKKALDFKISDLSALLRSYDVEGGVASNDVARVFYNQLNEHIATWYDKDGNLVSRTQKYSSDAKRSFLSKEGIFAGGAFPVSSIPLSVMGSMPYFPAKGYDGENIEKTNLEWLQNLVERANNLREGISHEELTKGKASDEITELYETLLESLKAVFEDLTEEEKQAGKNILKEGGFSRLSNKSIKKDYDISEGDYLHNISNLKQEAMSDFTPLERVKEIKQELSDMETFVVKYNQNAMEDAKEQEDMMAENTAFASRIRALLDDLPDQQTFTYQDFEDIRGDWAGFNLHDFQVFGQGAEAKYTTREAMEQKIVELVNNKYTPYTLNLENELNSALGEVNKRLYYDALIPYVEEYMSADSKGMKAAITKRVKTDLGVDYAKVFKTDKNKILDYLTTKPLFNPNEVVEVEFEDITPDIPQIKEEPKTKVVEKTQATTIDESSYEPDYEALLESSSLQAQVEETTEAIQKEKEELSDTKAIEEHSEAVKDAAEAEKAKIIVSGDLQQALNKESEAATKAEEDVSEAIQQNYPDEISFGKIDDLKFDDAKHQYSSNGEKFYSITQLRDLLLRGKNPAFSEDLNRIKEYANAHGSVTAADIGMSQKDFDFMSKGVIGQGIKGDVFHSTIDKMVKAEVTSLEELQQKDLSAFQSYQKERENALKELQKYGLGEDFLALEQSVESYISAMKKSGLTPTAFSEQRLGFQVNGPKGQYKIGVTPDQLYSWGVGGQQGGAFVDNKTGHVSGYEALQLTAQYLATKANEVDYKDLIGEVDLTDDAVKLYIADINDGVTNLIEYQMMSLEEFYSAIADAYAVAKGERSHYTKEEVAEKLNRQLKSGRIVGEATTPQPTGIDYNARHPSYRGFGGESYEKTLAGVMDDQDIQAKDFKGALRQYQRETDTLVKSFVEIYNTKERIKVLDDKMATLANSSNDADKNALTLLEKQKTIEEAKLKTQQEQYAIAQKAKEKTGVLAMAQAAQINEQAVHTVEQVDINAMSQAKSGLAMSTARADYQEEISRLRQAEQVRKSYLKSLKEQQKIERDILSLQNSMDGQIGPRSKEQQKLLDMYQSRLQQIKDSTVSYDATTGKFSDGTALNEQERLQFNKEIEKSQAAQAEKMAAINLRQKESVGLIQSIANGFKASFRNLTDYSLAYAIIGKIRQSFNQLWQSTQQLNSAMVDLQIASGMSFKEVKNMMYDFNALGKELGKSTQEVAQAANDWLRAGYEGAEATELVRNSMQLSVLGMINSAEATEYLISMLKGWKLEVKEVGSIVDKLTAVDMAAAISAGDLATALARANTSAQLAGSSLDNYIAYTTVVAETTQKSAESVGESFKTLYARFGKIAAGKFETSQEELEQEGLSEEDMANLNEIEQVLRSVGIELRDSAESFRNIDEVIKEIASKWSTFTDVQKSGISTAVAGTRQRENFLVLMNNFENVAKYAEISANSYGTAVEKMNAYTDSVEASQKRVQAAVENLALWLNMEGLQKKLNNLLAGVIDNALVLSTAVIAIISALNSSALGAAFGGAVNKFTDILTGLGQIGYLASPQNIGGALKKNANPLSQAFSETMGEWDNLRQEQFVAAQQKRYGTALGRMTAGADDVTQKYLLVSQSALLNEDADTQLLVAKELLADGITQETVTKLKSSTVDALLSNLTTEELAAKTEAMRQSVIAELNLTRSYVELTNEDKKLVDTRIRERLAAEQLTQQEKKYKDALGNNLRRASTQSTNDALWRGVGMLGGGYLGTRVGASIGKALGEESGMLGSMGGALLFSSLGNKLGGNLASGFKKLGEYNKEFKSIRNRLMNVGLESGLTEAEALKKATSGATDILKMQGKKKLSLVELFGGPAGIVAAGAMIAGMLYSAYNSTIDSMIKTAQNKFKEATEKYDKAQSAASAAIKFDKLANGVDYLGRNIDLTTEEYEEFLKASNEIAEVFPHLVARTDEFGNKLVGPDGLSGKVGKVTEEVEKLKDALKDEATAAMFRVDTSGFFGDWKQIANAIHTFTTGGSASVYGEAFGELKSSLENVRKESGLKKWQSDESLIFNANTIRNKDINTREEYEQQTLDMVDNYLSKSSALMAEFVQTYGKNIIELADINAKYSNYSGLADRQEGLEADEQSVINSFTSQLMSSAISGVQGGTIKEEDFNRMFLETNEKITKLVEDNPIVADIYYGTDDAALASEATALKEKYAQAIVDAFKDENGLISTDGQELLLSMGIITDEKGVKVAVLTLKDQILKALGSEDMALSDALMDKLSTEDAKKALRWANERWIGEKTTDENVVQMINIDREYDSEAGYYNRAKEKQNSYTTLQDRLQSYYKDVARGKKEGSKEEIGQEFSDLPENVRNAVAASAEELQKFEGSLKEFTKAVDDAVYNTSWQQLVSIQEDLAKTAEFKLSDAFGDIDGVEGVATTWAELKAVIDSVKNSYETLAAAQKEQDAFGKLSTQTVVSMLAENENYIELLDTSTGSIKLKANAQQEMTRIQLEALKANMEAANAEDEMTKAQLEREWQELNLAEVSGEATNDKIEANNEEIVSTNDLTKAYAELYAQIQAVNLAKAGDITGAEKMMESKDALIEAAGKVEQTKSTYEVDENYIKARRKYIQEQLGDWDPDEGFVNKGRLQERIDTRQIIMNDIQEMIDKGLDLGADSTGFFTPDLSNLKDAKEALEGFLSALEGIYNKEYYLMQVYKTIGEDINAASQDMFMSTNYYGLNTGKDYDKLASVYERQMKLYAPLANEETEEGLGYLQKYQEAYVKLKNLDDERVEDKINILQLQDVSYDQLIAAQEELIKTSDTLEEQITRENELNNLIKQRYELYRDIASWQREMLDIALEYESGTPDTAGYADLVSQKKQNLENEMEAVKQRMAEIQDSDRKDKQEELRNLAKQYAELYKEYATVDIDVLNDKLDVLERRLDLLEKSKPQEWAKYDDIAPYYQQNIGYLEQKAALIREQLEDVSMLTDEQVQNLVDQLNDVTVALHEAQMQMLEDQKNYKESQYNALVSKVQEYITELEDAMDEIEKAYEDELKPLEQANEERERAIKLEELLAAKKRAAQEKERVYRQGIGWVYESPRSKQREAQKDLDTFNRQDRIDDLTGTKDAEKEALQERIDNLNLYLKALQYQYETAERIERDRLLAEMMNIDQSLSNEEIQKEMRQRIMDDMQNFIEVQNNDYQNYLGIFSSFINSYTQLVLQLAELQRQALSLINSSQYLGSNAGGSFSITNATGGGGFGNALDRFDSGVDYSRNFQAEINGILGNKDNYGPDGKLVAGAKQKIDTLEGFHNDKIDKFGLPYEKTYGQSNATWSGGGGSSGGGSKKSSSSSPYNSKTDYNNESKYLDNLIKNGSAGQKAWAQNQKKELDKAQKGYADGIENGPVTYTGLSMLHGTHSKPEYVLNSDQAYNILRNLATTKLPEYTSTLSQDMGVSYVIQGDVVLENCDDPAQFWNQVMAATHNRYNVTKNKR